MANLKSALAPKPHPVPDTQSEGLKAANEVKPQPIDHLPFRILQGPAGPYLEYDVQTRLPDRTVTQPMRVPGGTMADYIIRIMERFREIERDKLAAESERDRALARAIGAEAELKRLSRDEMPTRK